jgi:uncharacterized protein (UPF0332 family)
MKDEAKELIQKAHDSLKVAEIIGQQGYYGFAASRAYLDPKYHRYFIDAEDYRNQGDYAVGKEVTYSQYQDSVTWAKEFIAAAETYLGAT